MPVRVAIQSSLVSTMASRSLLVITDEGTLLPLPLSLHPMSHCRTASASTRALDLLLHRPGSRVSSVACTPANSFDIAWRAIKACTEERDTV